MHKIIFYPVGNGDTSQIILENGKRVLIDFRHIKLSENDQAPEINLQETIRQELRSANRDYIDVLTFTHGDKDHIENSTEFFELLYAEKYQGDHRIKINELWVPAAMILESASTDQQSEEFVIWRQEARYRLKQNRGIRVFSKPDKLKRWFEDNGLDFESRKHLITDAGKCANGFSLENDGVEFFCHSPFVKHVDDNEEFRNEASLILNIRFQVGANQVDYLAIGDSTWDILEDIVQISKNHGNADRLSWDLFNVPHHCSYLALSDEKGEFATDPKPGVKELLQYGKENAHIICSSNPIEETEEALSQAQPPHLQAKRSYKKYLSDINGGKFFVTMEEPDRKNPKPIVFNIGESGICREGQRKAAFVNILSSPAPKAG